MNSATIEQIDQMLTRIFVQNGQSGMNEKMAGMRNYLFNELLSPEMADEMALWIESQSSPAIMGKILKVGDSAPDFTLTSATGQLIRLKSALKLGSAVVVFYRGAWCSFDNLYLKTIQEKLWEIKRLGAVVMAISPQTPDNCMVSMKKNNLEIAVLSDIGNIVARKFGLVHKLPLSLVRIFTELNIFLPVYNGDDSYELPVPGTFVISKDGKITHSFVNPDFTRRVDPEYIIETLKRLQ